MIEMVYVAPRKNETKYKNTSRKGEKHMDTKLYDYERKEHKRNEVNNGRTKVYRGGGESGTKYYAPKNISPQNIYWNIEDILTGKQAAIPNNVTSYYVGRDQSNNFTITSEYASAIHFTIIEVDQYHVTIKNNCPTNETKLRYVTGDGKEVLKSLSPNECVSLCTDTDIIIASRFCLRIKKANV